MRNKGLNFNFFVILQGLAGKTDLDEAKAAMIVETVAEFFMIPTFDLLTEKDKEKLVCIYMCTTLYFAITIKISE